MSYEEEVVIPPRFRATEGPTSRSRMPAIPPATRPALPPSDRPPPPEEGELRRRLAQLHGELAEASDGLARLHDQLSAERARGDELQHALDAAEQKARSAQQQAEDAQAQSTSAGLKLVELEQTQEESLVRERVALGELEALRRKVTHLEQSGAALQKEKDEAVALFEEACKDQEAEKLRRLRAEATLETEKSRHAAEQERLRLDRTAEQERLRLDHAAALIEAQREVRLEHSHREEELRGELARLAAQHQEELARRQEATAQLQGELEKARSAASEARTSLVLEQDMRSKARGAYESAMARTRGELERALREREEELAQSKERATEAFRALEELRQKDTSAAYEQLKTAHEQQGEALRQAQVRLQEAAQQLADARARGEAAEQRVAEEGARLEVIARHATEAEARLREEQERRASWGKQARATLAQLAASLDGFVGASEAGDQKR